MSDGDINGIKDRIGALFPAAEDENTAFRFPAVFV